MTTKTANMRSAVMKESGEGGDAWDYLEGTAENQNPVKR
jgi:hypothetical protein